MPPHFRGSGLYAIDIKITQQWQSTQVSGMVVGRGGSLREGSNSFILFPSAISSFLFHRGWLWISPARVLWTSAPRHLRQHECPEAEHGPLTNQHTGLWSRQSILFSSLEPSQISTSYSVSVTTWRGRQSCKSWTNRIILGFRAKRISSSIPWQATDCLCLCLWASYWTSFILYED